MSTTQEEEAEYKEKTRRGAIWIESSKRMVTHSKVVFLHTTLARS